jgi:pentatricopeptide repeat protein
MKRGDGKTQRVDKLRSDAESSGAQLDLQFYNSLLYAYVKSGDQPKAESLFEEIQKRFPSQLNAPTYNAMIDLATDMVDFDRLWTLYEQMQSKGIAPDEYTFIRMINLCGKQKKLDKAQVRRRREEEKGV